MKFKFKKITLQGIEIKERAKVKTEKEYIELLKKYKDESAEYTVIDYLWVESIISLGLQKTQKIIDDLFEFLNRDFSKVCFINQHISAENLDWKNGIVFSCHANSFNNFISIPHKPTVYSSVRDNKADFKYFLSFVGSFETHIIRRKINDINFQRKDIVIKDTGGWHFYNPSVEKEEFYIDTLKNSLFALCPRGTGHGTIRLFESLASKTIPVIISDNYLLPFGLEDNKNCILVKEQDIMKIEEILCNVSNEKINNLLNEVDLYRNKYLFENFEYSITNQINNLRK